MTSILASRLSSLSLVMVAALVMAGCPEAPVPPPGGVGPLNDTGITTCSDADTSGLSCGSVPAFPGQDGQYGRDLTANNSDGHAGFHFTKLGANGRALAIQNGTWSDNGSEAAGTRWACVRDEVTGRTWEVKDNDPKSVHYRDHTYSWYSPDPETRGGIAGSSGSGNCNGTLPVSGQYTGCDTYTFPKYINEHGGLCGYTDWRVPEIQELRSILDLSVIDPPIDTAYFPNTITIPTVPRSVWTATPWPSKGTDAWYVSFTGGVSSFWDKVGGRAGVRLVRGGQ